MICSFCGYQFDEEEVSSNCEGCPFSKGCNKICCPNCGYEVPAKSKFVDFIKKRRKRNESK